MKSTLSALLNNAFSVHTCSRSDVLSTADQGIINAPSKAHDVKAWGGQLILFQALRTIAYSEASGAARHTYNTLEIMRRYVFCSLELQHARSPPDA